MQKSDSNYTVFYLFNNFFIFLFSNKRYLYEKHISHDQRIKAILDDIEIAYSKGKLSHYFYLFFSLNCNYFTLITCSCTITIKNYSSRMRFKNPAWTCRSKARMSQFREHWWLHRFIINKSWHAQLTLPTSPFQQDPKEYSQQESSSSPKMKLWISITPKGYYPLMSVT